MSQFIGHMRASHWLTLLDGNSESDSEFWKVSSQLCTSLPAQIRRNGLALAVQQNLPKPGKMDADSLAKGFVLHGLCAWLSGGSDRFCLSIIGPAQQQLNARNLVLEIIKADVSTYMRAVEEALLWLEWGKAHLRVKSEASTDAD